MIESSGRSYITVNDPACGGGVQLIGAYKAAIAQGVNPSTQLCFYAEDIDTTCVFMTYVQLSLLGVPALVSHRNTISMETWSQWRTPVWWLHGFEYREQRRRHMGEAIEPTRVEPSTEEDAPVVRVNLRRDRAVEQVPVVPVMCDVDLKQAKQAELFAM